MSGKIDSQLDASWLVNDAEDEKSNISWAEDSEPSDIDEKPPPEKSQSLPRQRKVTPQRTLHTEFIMPSLGDRSVPSKSLATKRRFLLENPRQEVWQKSRLVNTASTPAAQRSRKPESRTLANAAIGGGKYILDIVVSTLKTLKRPISWVLAAYLFAGLLVLVQNLLTSTIKSAFSPVCRIPGVSFLQLPICNSPYTFPDQPIAQPPPLNQPTLDFDALMTVQGKFESVLRDNSAVIALPFVMQRSVSSLHHLHIAIEFSSIPSKNELLQEFDFFRDIADILVDKLLDFNSHVGRAVDLVLVAAKYTHRVLDNIANKTSNSGPISEFINRRLLAPFQPLEYTESLLLSQYMTHADYISEEIDRLLDEAQMIVVSLNALEKQVDTIYSISLRDNIATKASRNEILGQLWTYLGGNRAKLSKFNNQLSLLAEVGQYRNLAYTHVTGLVSRLQAMKAELKGLKERVNVPAVTGGSGAKGIPLWMHAENIRMGVERLEGENKKAKELEWRFAMAVLDRPGREGELVLDEA